MEVRTLTGDKPDRSRDRHAAALARPADHALAARRLPVRADDCILLEHFLGAQFVAYYSPAIQIDAALLLLVSGLAVVLYPKSAIAHAAGDIERLKHYYIRGTLISFALLLPAAVVVWATSGGSS
jgi:hypothetical protein